jgi:hypothetical protein
VTGLIWRVGEGFAVCDSEISLIAVVESCEAFDDQGQDGSGGDYDVEIDDGLGGETWDGGAADVFDCDGVGFDRRPEAVVERLEYLRPRGIVIDDGYTLHTE